MEYAVFLGCTIPTRQMNYEQSARAVSEALGVKLVDLDFGCCGFPIEPLDEVRAISLATMNLKKAAESGLDVVALCSACAEMMSKAKYLLEKDHVLLRKVNDILGKKVGEEYRGESPKVIHFIRMLYEYVGVDKIRSMVKRSFGGLRIAVHYGCHYMRPSELFGKFDDPEYPTSLDELVEATGAKSVDYYGKNDCCGGSILAISETVAKDLTAKKLVVLSEAEVDAMVLACPFCGIMYDRYQQRIFSELGIGVEIPVLYYSQLLGLALNIKPDLLGVDVNSVNIESVLEKSGGVK